MDAIDTIVSLIGGAIYYPLFGMIVMVAGWSVGQIVMSPTVDKWSSLSKYGHLFVLGFIADALMRGYFTGHFGFE